MTSPPEPSRYSYAAIVGPTGSGKSGLALALAQQLPAEIVSCDSVQVYRGFDLGAAKATRAEQAAVPHHLLDCAAWNEDFDAARYATEAAAAIAAIRARGRLPIVVGGTGLYLRALLGQGWHADLPQDAALRAELAQVTTADLAQRLRERDPQRASEVHANDRVRLLRSLELVLLLGKPLRAAGLDAKAPRDPAAFVIVLAPERPGLQARIALRTRAMLAAGLVAEVDGLLASGVHAACKPMQSIGYKQVVSYRQGLIGLADLPEAIMAATRQYAKRQDTWFRSVAADRRLPGPDLDAAQQQELVACLAAMVPGATLGG